jgi:hypothetical protein
MTEPIALPPHEQLVLLRQLDRLFQSHGVSYWLFGGWAVDFHAGRWTRPHGDIDLAVWSVDRMRIAELLAAEAWSHVPEPSEDGYTCYARGAVRLETAFLARDDTGRIHTPLRNGRAEWPLDAFGDDVLELLGTRARVISRRALIAEKSVVHDDALTAAKDRADLAILVSLR